MHRIIQRLRADQRGLAFIEFALLTPFILLILFGGIELTRFMLVVQKLDKTAYALANITAQYVPATADRRDGEINVNEMNTVVFRQFAALMEPYDAAANGSVIMSSIRRERDVIRIKWQIASPGYTDGETVSAVSGLTPAGVNGAGAALRDRAASFTGDAALEMTGMLGYENMIVSEVFFRYQPILSRVLQRLQLPLQLGDTTLVRRLYARPRIGNLICLPPTFIYDECTSRAVGSCGAGACIDECGACRPNAREWCTATGSTRNLVRCTNGTNVNQNLPDACTGVGTISCP